MLLLSLLILLRLAVSPREGCEIEATRSDFEAGCKGIKIKPKVLSADAAALKAATHAFRELYPAGDPGNVKLPHKVLETEIK